MATTVEVKTSINTCEDYARHVGSRTATADNPVLRIIHNGANTWRCMACINKALSTNAVEDSEDRNICEMDYCNEPAARCMDHLEDAGDCSECGDTAYYCSASCAVDAGESFRSSCSRCGEESYYCSADCAIADGSETSCFECGENTRVICTTDDCSEKHVPTPTQPTLVAAASPIIQQSDTDTDGNITINGVEIRFS